MGEILRLAQPEPKSSPSPSKGRGRRRFGAVRRLPSGRWQASYLVDGRRCSAPTTFATRTDADKYLARVETEIFDGRWIDPAGPRTLLADYARAWLDAKADLRPKPRETYQTLLNKYILPELGAKSFNRLTPQVVREWHQALRAKSPHQAAKAYRLLAAIMHTAVTDRLIVQTPCALKGAGREQSPERPTLSVDDVFALAEAIDPKFKVAVHLATWCHLRRGEILGLKRRDIDLATATLTVERQVQEVTLPDEEGRQRTSRQVGRPKTDAGARKVAIPAHLCTLLEEYLSESVPENPDAFLWSAKDGGPMWVWPLQRAWTRARTVVGRPEVHLHDLRHAGLTWAATTGATIRELMARGGHASPAAAMRYQHAASDRDREIAEGLDRLAKKALLHAGCTEEVPATEL